jgi:hypothetical protein
LINKLKIYVLKSKSSNFRFVKNRFSDDGLYSQIQGAAYDFSDQEWEGVSEDSKDLVAAYAILQFKKIFYPFFLVCQLFFDNCEIK